MRTLVATLLFALILVLGSTALGQDAAKAFKDGLKLFNADKYAEALPLFESAVDASGSPNARIYLARCMKELGRTVEAYDQMKRTVEDATRLAETDPKYRPTRDSGAAELAILERSVAKIVIAVADPPSGTEVRLGDRTIPAERLGDAIAVEPGTLQLRVTAPGKKPIERDIEIAAGEMETVPLTFDSAVAATEPAPPPRPDPDTPVETSGGEIRIVGFIVGGLGIVGVGIGAGLAAKVESDFNAIDDDCRGTTCPVAEQSRVDDGRSLQLGANIALLGGAGLAAIGLAMIIFGGPTEAPVESAAVVPLPGGGALQVGGRF